MNVLLVHQNFPGQFLHLARRLSAMPGVNLMAICRDTAASVPGVSTLRYSLHREVKNGTHHYLRSFESGVLHGQAVLRSLLELKRSGYKPDVVVAHAGWGEATFVKDVFPDCRYVGFFEFFYRAEGADVGFDPEDSVTMDERARLRCRNALHLVNLEAVDVGVSPTAWQRSVHPEALQSKLHVIHEGIDTRVAAPRADASFTLASGQVLTRKDKVVTYIGRNLEPYRGFPQMMRLTEKLCALRGDVHVVVVGGDGISYGRPPQDAASWKEKMLRECNLDEKRVHFTGMLPYAKYLDVLAISSAHVYLTYPFVLSWSMMEAMSSGCLVIGSDTQPVRELIRHGENGLLVDFFDVEAQLQAVLAVLDKPDEFAALRASARETIVSSYTVQQGTDAYLRLIGL